MTPDFLKLLQEAVARPESPAGLHVQSIMTSALKPANDAIVAVIEAIIRHQADASPANAKILNASITKWEALTGQTFDNTVAADFNQMASDELRRRRTRPPAMEDILQLTEALDRDYEYEIAGTLGGIRGIWHRMWSSLSMEHAKIFPEEPGAERLSATLRREFEESFGRPLSENEWNDLASHARINAETVVIPHLESKKRRD